MPLEQVQPVSHMKLEGTASLLESCLNSHFIVTEVAVPSYAPTVPLRNFGASRQHPISLGHELVCLICFTISLCAVDKQYIALLLRFLLFPLPLRLARGQIGTAQDFRHGVFRASYSHTPPPSSRPFFPTLSALGNLSKECSRLRRFILQAPDTSTSDITTNPHFPKAHVPLCQSSPVKPLFALLPRRGFGVNQNSSPQAPNPSPITTPKKP